MSIAVTVPPATARLEVSATSGGTTVSRVVTNFSTAALRAAATTQASFSLDLPPGEASLSFTAFDRNLTLLAQFQRTVQVSASGSNSVQLSFSADAPTPSPSASTPAGSPSASTSPVPSASSGSPPPFLGNPSASPSASTSPTASPSAGATASPTVSPTASPTLAPTPTPTVAPTPTPTPVATPTPTPSPTATPVVSFSGSVQPIFTANCSTSGCHDSSGGAGLDLRTGNSYAQLVNVTSSQDGSWKRVVANDTTNSLLYRKVNDASPPVGGRMPVGGQLSQSQIDTIRNWILQGALNN